MNAEEFLNQIHGIGQTVHFRAIGPKCPKSLSGTWAEVRGDLLNLNHDGYDIYFVVNKGGTCNDQIVEFTAVWSDLDAGKTPDGQYRPLPEVQMFKEGALKRLLGMSCPPSLVVETRNGYHAYWLLEAGVTLVLFVRLMERLASLTGGDTSVNSPSNLMRMPGFLWRKLRHGRYEPFEVTVVHEGAVRYDGNDLLDALGTVPSEVERCAAVGTNNDLGSSTVRPVLGKPKSVTEIRGLLTGMDMAAVLEFSSSIVLCPFHDDTSPSGSVYQSKTDGSWYFKCHASSCRWWGDAISFVARRDGVGEGRALLMLVEQQGVVLADESPVLHLRQRLSTCWTVIRDWKSLKEKYPRLWNRARFCPSVLEVLLKAAQDCILRDEQFLADGRYIFFIATRRVARMAHLAVSTTNHRLALLAYLGLIEKIGDDHIPSELLDRSERVRVRRGHGYRITYISVPEFTPEVLAEAERRATEFLENGMTSKGISWTMFVYGDGEDGAQRVYPQDSSSSVREVLKDEAVAAAKGLLETKGYVRRADLYERLNAHRACQKTAVAQVFPALVREFGLSKRYATKELKAQFRIISDGCPVIFIPAESVSAPKQQETVRHEPNKSSDLSDDRHRRRLRGSEMETDQPEL